MSASFLSSKTDENAGVCKIVSAGLTTIDDVDIPKETNVLNLTDNKICDFCDFEDSEYLTSLILDKNPILSFRGFPRLPNLEELSLFETPISQLKNFRQLAIIAAGENLKVLNGMEVSKHEIELAHQYSPDKELEGARNMVILGWLPTPPSYGLDIRPVGVNTLIKRAEKKHDITIIESPKSKQKSRKSKQKSKAVEEKQVETPKKKADPAKTQREQLEKVLQTLNKQERDPNTVRAVRILRSIGYDKEQIKAFLRETYSPKVEVPKKAKKAKKQKNDPSSLEGQLEKVNETLEVLAAKLSSVRSRNRNYDAYEAMLEEVAGPLFENARILNESQEEEEDSQEVNDQNEKKEENNDDYIKLRLAVCDYLKADPSMGDDTIIQIINDLNGDEEEEEEEFVDIFEEGNEGEEEEIIDANNNTELNAEEEECDIEDCINIKKEEDDDELIGTVKKNETIDNKEEEEEEEDDLDLGITLKKNETIDNKEEEEEEEDDLDLGITLKKNESIDDNSNIKEEEEEEEEEDLDLGITLKKNE